MRLACGFAAMMSGGSASLRAVVDYIYSSSRIWCWACGTVQKPDREGGRYPELIQTSIAFATS